MPEHLKHYRTARLKVAVRGAVQGVGFRPFVFRLATDLGLAGWVSNSPQGLCLEVEGARASVERFLPRLRAEKPPRSFIQGLEASWLDLAGHTGFEIRQSQTRGDKSALVMADTATCPDCLREIFDPANRRFRYPFTNCIHCGPRFSIIESLPYDRANTSMKRFPMCPRCQAEYEDPRNRRFHAQPNACPLCGPHLELWSASGDAIFGNHHALLAAACAIRRGRIVGLKGLGGFQLVVAARDSSAVRRLRQRKHREEKPFALMFPSLAAIQSVCEVSPLEERLLLSLESPIVLLRRLPSSRSGSVSPEVAPGNPYLGAMLPSTPLHHLLLSELQFPVVATSGNLSDEPICTDEHEALQRLHGIADLFLVHDRPIVRHVDDSVVRVMLDRELVLRRARGYAPLPITLNRPHSKSILAVGGHLKNAVALSVGPDVFISQHIGDLETEPANTAFRRVIQDFEKLYDTKPAVVAADLHPDYLSTRFAREFAAREPNSRCIVVQHHLAHVLSCMAENEVEPPALGVAWDGTGYGLDGTIWGGEFFDVTETAGQRIAHFRPFRLPGGDAAVKEPRRSALGLLYEIFGESVFERRDLAPVAAFSRRELAALKTMLTGNINSPLTSSVGRLFDAMASLIGLRQTTRFEGQAAMELEFARDGVETELRYELPLLAPQSRSPAQPLVLDWAPMLHAVLNDLELGKNRGEIAAKFHNALAETIVAVARHAALPRVALSGGCFQNRCLTERAVVRLRQEGFRPYWHQRVPPNDGGLALGQIVAALRQNRVTR